MLVGKRLRVLREERNLSQGDIERRAGLLRCYTSRVENGYTVPALETLEKFAQALEVPTYMLFYDGEHPPSTQLVPSATGALGHSAKERKYLERFHAALGRMSPEDRHLLLLMVAKMARKSPERQPSKRRPNSAH